MQTEVVRECVRLRQHVVQPISERYHGPLDASTVHNTQLPMVLLLGNHSSGKSSFINHLLQREVQASGVAPTDDAFTIIVPGDEDIDRAGPAVVGDPDLGFSGLVHFGPVLVHKTQLKIRKLVSNRESSPISPGAEGAEKIKGNPVKQDNDTEDKDVRLDRPARCCNDFMMIDTPGMIDSPVKANASLREKVMDRGYDFEGVVRWYAERSDLILVFFDPDKPGTTGETLSCLVNSLQGFDHKLHLCLNKADKFRHISDFARAYGSLCWNLSKVIPRKDLPQIHTMCLPRQTIARLTQDSSRDTLNEGADEQHFLSRGLASLDAERRMVEAEIFNAPRRRVDNEVSRLADSVHVVLMHCRIVDETVAIYQEALWSARYKMLAATALAAASTALVGVAAHSYIVWGHGHYVSSNNGTVATGSSSAGPSESRSLVEVTANAAQTAARASLACASLSGMSLAGFYYWQQLVLQRIATALGSIESFTDVFRRLYARQIDALDEFTFFLWDTVRARLQADLAYEPAAVDSNGNWTRGSNMQSRGFLLASIHTENKLAQLPRVAKEDMQALHRITEKEIPTLRRQAAAGADSTTSNTRSGAASSSNGVRGVPLVLASSRYDSFDHSGLFNVAHAGLSCGKTGYAVAQTYVVDAPITVGGYRGAVVSGDQVDAHISAMSSEQTVHLGSLTRTAPVLLGAPGSHHAARHLSMSDAQAASRAASAAVIQHSAGKSPTHYATAPVDRLETADGSNASVVM